MSIAEKLQTIAENEEKVFRAGKLAILNASKYMHPTVSGSVIAINDFSDINPNLNIKLKNDTITDFSNVTVSRLGKNLIPYPYKEGTKTSNGITFTNNGDGSVTVNGELTSGSPYMRVFDVAAGNGIYLPPGTYTLSGCPNGSYVTYFIRYNFYRLDDNTKLSTNDVYNSKTITFTDPVELRNVFISIKDSVENLVFKPQIELGTVATEYELYKEPHSVLANADGTVTGFTDILPNMTFKTDIAGINISCEYYRDIDTYIDKFH